MPRKTDAMPTDYRRVGTDETELDLPEGVADLRTLPDPDFLADWDAIITGPGLKERLLSQAVLNFTMRARVDPSRVPLHGLIVLVGPPGNGKTSLARGLAARTAETIQNGDPVRYLEVAPHSLTSAALGRSQQAVRKMFEETIAEHAAFGRLIVLLDEVETIAADRSKLSLQANPIDVHRASDAVLSGLDYLARRHPALLFLATSNFRDAVDSAFLSRADLIVTLGPPSADACRLILENTLGALGAIWPSVAELTMAPDFSQLGERCVGLDGRQVRKAVVAACAFDKATALDPSRLTTSDLARAIDHARTSRESEA
mgnify:CR=1 FL=1